MEGRKVVMADGTELLDAEIGYTDQHIWCFLKNVTFPEAYDLFSDPLKTQVLIFDYGDMQDVHEGFTELHTIKKTEDGVNVRMNKPEVLNADS